MGEVPMGNAAQADLDALHGRPMLADDVQRYADADMPASVGGAQRLAQELLALREAATAVLGDCDDDWQKGVVLAVNRERLRALLPEASRG